MVAVCQSSKVGVYSLRFKLYFWFLICLFFLCRTMNPSPIVDKQKDAIVLVFAAFPTDMSFHDLMYFAGHPTSKLFVMKVCSIKYLVSLMEYGLFVVEESCIKFP